MHKVAIWTPINKAEGFGHFYRMMGLYELLQESDISTTYFTNSDYIKLEQVDILQCNTNKIGEIVNFLKKCMIEVIIIDNYNTTLNDIEYLTKYFKIAFFDAKFQNPKVDIIMNFNPYATENYLTKHNDTKYFLGLNHMCFRQDLRKIQNMSVHKDTVFISIGGTDITETTYRLLKYLPLELTYHIVLGKGCSDKYYQKVSKYLNDNNFSFHLYKQPKDYFEIMGKCEVAICSCSTTTYELTFLSKPFFCINVVSNQNMITSYLNKHGIATFKKDHLEDIGTSIEKRLFSKLAIKKNKHSNLLFDSIQKLLKGN